MSWLPAHDPVLGDRRSCEALDLVIAPRARDLGGFTVHRTLPHGKRQMVGPFIFFDQMGPVQFIAGQGMDVRPHPHIGLATVTYLFGGSVMHRDSEGNAVEIIPGEMNLMTAGRGIAHSERTPQNLRAGGAPMFGIQSWLALPTSLEETEPSFQHFDAVNLPIVESDGVWARIIAGSLFGKMSPVQMMSEWFYAEVRLNAGATVPLDPDYEQRAIYVAEGSVEIGAERFAAPSMLIFRPGERITVRSEDRARLLLLGGAAVDGPRHIWWNFVSSRKERIEQAKEDWKAGRFASVPGELEFIPLPDA